MSADQEIPQPGWSEGIAETNIRNILLKERDRLMGRIHSLTDGQLGEPLSQSVGELSSYDNHTADLGTETFEREKDVTLRGQARWMVRQIDRALEKLEAGSYGKCDRCGRSIEPARLQARPYATLCYECQVREEKEYEQARNLEEAPPPFGRSFRNEEGYNGYDGEDAWQDVARYGNANSPQDEPDSITYQDIFVDADEDTGAVERMDTLVDLEGRGVANPDLIYPELVSNHSRRPHPSESGLRRWGR